ncbi:hypothetical protein AB0C93_17535 [Streptomyces sp. NPDC048518]|uniref:hypothetical protein n=1 Tax=Streptomyces sp. NPDC048518 TaxID=3155029 RepID=UPI0033EC623D
MPVPLSPPLCSPECVPRIQRAIAAALAHYMSAPIAPPYYVRGCIPEPDEAAVTVALWTGPAARDKWNLFLLIPLVSDGLVVSAVQVTTGLMRLGRGTHIFGSAGRRFDGKPVLRGSQLVAGRPLRASKSSESSACPCLEGSEPEGPKGFYYQRPGQLTWY